MDNTEIIKTMDLTKIYQLGTSRVTAIDNISFSVKQGEVLAIQGVSGSGKSTLLHLIGGIVDHTSGKIISCGYEITNLPEKDLTEYRKKKIGFIFQFNNLSPILTSEENVELPLRILGKPREERKRKVKELLQWVNMEKRANHPPFALSGGERQRIAVLVALANDPELILADEPTGELDTANTKIIASLLKKLNEDFGKTVVLVTHNPVVANIANRILNMKDGKLYYLEKLEFTNPFCPQCYTTKSKGINYCSNCGKLITSYKYQIDC